MTLIFLVYGLSMHIDLMTRISAIKKNRELDLYDLINNSLKTDNEILAHSYRFSLPFSEPTSDGINEVLV